MGYFLGINNARFFVDDDGSVWSNEAKTYKVADSIDAIGKDKEEEQKVDELFKSMKKGK